MTYSFESRKVFDRLLLPDDAPERAAIRIMNPLGEDFAYMRTLSVGGMLTSLSVNYNRRNKDVRLFEMANVYLPKALPLTELPDERMKFTAGAYGDIDFFGMKGLAQEIFDVLRIPGEIEYVPSDDIAWLHPGRQARILHEGREIGCIGEVHPAAARNFEIGDRAYLFVLDIIDTAELASFEPRYSGIAKFPAVSRDLSMLVPREVTAGQIEKVIRVRGGKLLESYHLFDIYEGIQVRPGCKSMAYNLVFRDREKTLEDQEVTKAMDKILNGLGQLGIELRS